MAARNRAYTHRHDEAQPADQHNDDSARKARTRMRRATEVARHREQATLDNGDKLAGSEIGDRQGEVA
ncbi:hypothetical protein [Halococcus thailandensis]|uniref:Uncharacterized protein n=1 Tax=Halococcus thailandensis JCM 13552 TaxID=1227457 RepID=M0NDD5_9EURY|nr:hypothetical protein [Halococcus thailandensis]EMA55987.1 hypothetical protein C451_04536 [Halococcus thailandensis JCM 13552]